MYVRSVTVVTLARRDRHGPALAHKTHILRSCPRRRGDRPPAGALAAAADAPPRVGVAKAKPLAISALAPPVARFHRTIRVISQRMAAEHRAEKRRRERRELFASLPGG